VNSKFVFLYECAVECRRLLSYILYWQFASSCTARLLNEYPGCCVDTSKTAAVVRREPRVFSGHVFESVYAYTVSTGANLCTVYVWKRIVMLGVTDYDWNTWLRSVEGESKTS
jgi:hypothetical protein